ncbi:unnamed protein product [Caenorhabditis auriculariae]|uniref:DIX domain-containing protein n=1 Tax=Caenorhabditis auriculariae TaxID=2777116 RepID=A0A8S1HE02_9PELO|nr:unnamed protein product [Caenorhabditis auriculariae]
MASTPPNGLELDTSDVATPCTIIDATKRLRIHGDHGYDHREPDDCDLRSDVSEQFSQTSDATTTVKQPFPQTSTKVYYHIDDETTPYLTEVHVPPDFITLGDVKRVLMRSNFKYYCKAVDPDSGYEVKAEMRDDMQKLSRSPNGRFELFLLTTEGSTHSDGSSGLRMPRHHIVPGPAPNNMYLMNHNLYRQAANQFDNTMMSTDSESMVSAQMTNYVKPGYNNRRQFQQAYMGGQFVFV